MIKQIVKQALARIPGNQTVSSAVIVLSAPQVECNGGMISSIIARDITNEQLKRALRDIPYVKRVNGGYRVKGRKVV